MDIRSSANEGRAAAGRLLAELKPEGRREITPITAEVDPANCSGCMLCLQTCPFAAIAIDRSANTAMVLGELCDGCGICVAACPAGAITGRHFTGAILAAELTGVLDESRK
jgi:heterodisulfide reductase subunit A